MKKTEKLRHTLYELRMKLIDLEFRAKSHGLSKHQEAEMLVLQKKVSQLEEKIGRQKDG
jgi:hypothetical protein